ncbi:hypothetical protein GCM10009602_59010 [Nocardiopsis tropica]
MPGLARAGVGVLVHAAIVSKPVEDEEGDGGSGVLPFPVPRADNRVGTGTAAAGGRLWPRRGARSARRGGFPRGVCPACVAGHPKPPMWSFRRPARAPNMKLFRNFLTRA